MSAKPRQRTALVAAASLRVQIAPRNASSRSMDNSRLAWDECERPSSGKQRVCVQNGLHVQVRDE